MAQYRGIVQGNRESASRLGSKASGIDAIGNAWNIGGRVTIHYNETTGRDTVRLWATSGSNHHKSDILIAEFDNLDNLKDMRL